MKTYIITLSRTFLSRHPRVGEPTYFADKFRKGQGATAYELFGHTDYDGELYDELYAKIHTIRGNYDLWARRIKEVQEGKAMLSIRVWSGKPYNSPQTTIATLTAEHGIGVQKVTFHNPFSIFDCRHKFENLAVDGNPVSPLVVCENDGLCYNDFTSWFKYYDLSEPMVVIHFTKFRY